MKNFAITGVAGYIAPRHLKAIKETGNNLIAAVDPHDSVGILDQYFSEAAFFTEIERFDRHLEKLKRKGEGIDYLTICSPNHLHDAHIRLALRLGADVICEKPLVLNPWNLDALQKLEEEYGKKVYTILQLRAHPALIALKEKLKIQNSKFKTKHEVLLTYITSRGPWYKYSWKGDQQKSGGIATNIGIHFFDLLIWLFGKVEKSEVHLSDENKMAGFLELKNANVKWFLSIDKNDLSELNLSSISQSTDHKPQTTDNRQLTTDNLQLTTYHAPMTNDPSKNSPGRQMTNDKLLRTTDSILKTFRSIKIDNEEIEFTEGFTDLHTKVYSETLAGRGFGIETARPSVELVYSIRNEKITAKPSFIHPYAQKILGIK